VNQGDAACDYRLLASDLGAGSVAVSEPERWYHAPPRGDPRSSGLLYAYAIGVRSSRQIQRQCTQDLAFRALAGNQVPDHVTIA
jgi:hypothetical protein